MSNKNFTEEFAELVSKEEDSKVEATSESQPETDNSAPTPSQEEKQEKPDSAEEKDVPFHKHPRWKRITSELDELRAFKEEQLKKAQEIPKQVEQAVSKVPPQYQKVFGDDVEAFKEWQGFMREEARKEADALYQERITQQEREAQKIKETEAKVVSWAESQFVELSEDLGIDLTNKSNTARNQILDICETYGLFTKEGMPNIQKANELRLKLYPEVVDETLAEKKRVIAKTNAKSNSSHKEPEVWTPSALRKKSMSQFFNN